MEFEEEAKVAFKVIDAECRSGDGNTPKCLKAPNDSARFAFFLRALGMDLAADDEKRLGLESRKWSESEALQVAQSCKDDIESARSKHGETQQGLQGCFNEWDWTMNFQDLEENLARTFSNNPTAVDFDDIASSQLDFDLMARCLKSFSDQHSPEESFDPDEISELVRICTDPTWSDFRKDGTWIAEEADQSSKTTRKLFKYRKFMSLLDQEVAQHEFNYVA